MSVEGNTQHAYGYQISDIHAATAFLDKRFADSPKYGGYQAENVENEAGVKRKSQSVDEEQLEPSSYFHDARYDAV